MKEWRKRWTALWTGGEPGEPAVPELARSMEQAGKRARRWLDAMDRSPSRTALWEDCRASDSGMLTKAYDRIRDIALARSAEGTGLYRDSSVENDLRDALGWMYRNRYNEYTEPYGNWWHWEIGAPLSLAASVLLLYDVLDRTERSAYMRAVDRFAPEPDTYLHALRMRKPSTGTNRVWICKVIALRSLILEDRGMLDRVRHALSPVFGTVTQGDGFYRDGSFIQHGKHPYTGGYGVSLLNELVQLAALLHGTPYAIPAGHTAQAAEWVFEAFEPLMFRGSMMDMVRGRVISREDKQDHETGHDLISSVLLLSTVVQEKETARRLAALAKHWILSDTSKDYMAFAPPYGIRLAAGLLQDEALPPHKPGPRFKLFSHMDRAVCQGDGFAAGLSMYSDRIAAYESINGENLRGWYTAHGHLSLYNGDLTHYSDGYWPTVDSCRLAGITVTDLPRGEGEGQDRCSPRSWVGGAELTGRYGCAGMELEDFPDGNGERLFARKSWFMLGDMIAALGSCIRHAGEARVETVFENRRLHTDWPYALTVNGIPQTLQGTWEGEAEPGTWLHLEDGGRERSIGYLVLERGLLRSHAGVRTGRWSDIGTGRSEPLTRRYWSLRMDHGTSPSDGRYAYLVLPGADREGVERMSREDRPVRIVELSGEAHIVVCDRLGITGMHVWQDGWKTCGGLGVNRKAAVMMQRKDRLIHLAVSDPTHRNEDGIAVRLELECGEILTADPRIQVRRTAPFLELFVRTGGAGGSSAGITLAVAD